MATSTSPSAWTGDLALALARPHVTSVCTTLSVRVEFEYLNLEWQEALFTEVFDDPRNRMSFVVSNKQLPCNEEYIFVAKAYGVNGE